MFNWSFVELRDQEKIGRTQRIAGGPESSQKRKEKIIPGSQAPYQKKRQSSEVQDGQICPPLQGKQSGLLPGLHAGPEIPDCKTETPRGKL